MTGRNNEPQNAKISREFATRLNRLDPKQKVRAIVMLRARENGPAPTRSESRESRQAIIDEIRRSANEALPEIDKILERFEGKRLANEVNALGAIPVEATAAGIVALAASNHVKAILEDQPITSLHTSKYF